MNVERLIENSTPFLNYVVAWKADLASLIMGEIVNDHPDHMMLNGIEVVTWIA